MELYGGEMALSKPSSISACQWRKIADLVWQGMTVPDACLELGYDWAQVHKEMPTEVARYMVDVSMLANCREEYLGGD